MPKLAPAHRIPSLRNAVRKTARGLELYGPASVNVEQEVIRTLRSVLNLDPERHPLDLGSPLLGSVAELDSMAVVSILTALEEQLDLVVDDDEVDGRTFASVGSLVSFVQGKLDR